MPSRDFLLISTTISEASREGAAIFASAFVELTRTSSCEIGTQFTTGTRKVFVSTRDAWVDGGERLAARMKSELTRMSMEYFALQKSTVDDRWRQTQVGFSGALTSCMGTMDFLYSESLQGSASNLVSVYRTATEDSFLWLLQCSLHTCTQSLAHVLQTRLLDFHETKSRERKADPTRRKKANKPEIELSKHLVENLEEALCDSYRLLERVIEEEARQTLVALHASFVRGQARLFEKLQKGLQRGLSEVTCATSRALESHFLPLYTAQASRLLAFSTALSHNLDAVLATRAEALSIAQREIFENAAQDLTNAQVEMIQINIPRLMNVQKNSLNLTVVPLMLATLERQIELEGFV